MREHYRQPGGPDRCAALLPRRSKRAIYIQAIKLGLAEKRPVKKWSTTPEIDADILDAYAHPERGTVKDQLANMPRPYSWIKSRAMHLGCTFEVYRGGKGPEWSAAELALLDKHATKHPKSIAKIFAANGYHRTPTAIGVKRKRLRIDTVDIDHYTAHGLAQEFNCDIKTVVRWIDKGWLKASRRGTERKLVQGGDMWWIKRRDVRQFVVDHVGAVDFRKVDKVWLVDLLVHQ